MRTVLVWLLLCSCVAGQVAFTPSDHSCVYFTDSNVVTNLTLSIWLTPNELNDLDMYVIKGDGTGAGFYYNLILYPNADSLFFQVYAGGGYRPISCSSSVITTGELNHLCAVYSSTNHAIFVNGVCVTNAAQSYGPITRTGTKPMAIGRYVPQNPASQTINGSIEDARVYARALSANEVKQLYYTPWTLASDTTLVVRTCIAGDYDESLLVDVVAENTATNHGVALSERYAGWWGAFDGVTDHAESSGVLNSVNTNGVAFAFEVQVTSNKQGAIVSKNNDGVNERFCVFYRTGQQGVSFITSASGSGYQQLNGTANINDGGRHSVVVTWDTQYGKRIYIDGVLDGEDAAHTNIMASDTSPTYGLRIGDWAAFAAPSYTFCGDLSNVRIYNQPLTPADATNLCNGIAITNRPTAHYTMQPAYQDTHSTLSGVARNYGTGADGAYSNGPARAAGHIQHWKPAEASVVAIDPLKVGLVAEYLFDSDASDSSGKGNDGVEVGSMDISGGCAYFDGSGARIDIAHASSLVFSNELTFAFWGKLDTGSASQNYWLSKLNATVSRRSFAIFGQDAMAIFAYENGGTSPAKYYTTPSGIASTTPFHFVYRFDNGVLEVFKDGSLISVTKTIDNAFTSLYVSSQKIALGARGDNTNPLKGWLDSVRFWNRALSNEQIVELSLEGHDL